MQLHKCPVLVLLLVSTSSLSTRGAVFTAHQEDDVIQFVESLRQCRGIVGLTMAVVKGNETWKRGFGMADRESGRNVTTSDLFGIGSLTKAFTTALISLFIDTGRYSWQTPVVDILGKDFQLVNDQLTRELTLKDMLSHRTGLESTNIPLFAGSNLSRGEFVRRVRYLPVKAPFRDGFEYNNWMYGLAGNVVEVMGGGATWEEILQARLLQPLNMTHTGVMGKTVSVLDNNFAKPYITLDGQLTLSDPAIYSIRPHESAGGIASSADDMAHWLLLHINKGVNQHGQRVLNDTRMREMWTPHVSLSQEFRTRMNIWRPVFPVTYASDGYGYGWMTATYRGYPVTWHSGGMYAYVSYIAFLPHMDLGIFISTNGHGKNSNASHINHQVVFYIADVLMQGVEPWLSLNNACHFPDLWLNNNNNNTTSDEEQPPASSNDTVVYDDPDFPTPNRFAGRYGHPLFGDVNVVRNGSRGLSVHYGHMTGQLLRGGEEEEDGEDDDNNSSYVGMWEVVGSMEPMFRDGNRTLYLRLNFTRPSSSSSSPTSSSSSQKEEKGTEEVGVFGEVLVGLPGEELVFRREVSPGASSGGGRVGGYRPSGCFRGRSLLYMWLLAACLALLCGR